MFLHVFSIYPPFCTFISYLLLSRCIATMGSAWTRMFTWKSFCISTLKSWSREYELQDVMRSSTTTTNVGVPLHFFIHIFNCRCLIARILTPAVLCAWGAPFFSRLHRWISELSKLLHGQVWKLTYSVVVLLADSRRALCVDTRYFYHWTLLLTHDLRP